MDNMKITNKLFELQDKEYGEFQAKLTPGIEKNQIIGVRVPVVRKLAKEYIKDEESQEFLNTLPHEYYDENMLHGLLISEIKDYEKCIELIDKFLPYVDNWAVCDIMSPKIFKKNKDKLIIKIKEWLKSEHTYTCRFGVEMIMTHFLDEDFKEEYLDMVSKIHSEEYYVQMVIAWLFFFSLAKQWDSTIPYLENQQLDKWIHNKTIQKARESYRITEEKKKYLKGLKR